MWVFICMRGSNGNIYMQSAGSKCFRFYLNIWMFHPVLIYIKPCNILSIWALRSGLTLTRGGRGFKKQMGIESTHQLRLSDQCVSRQTAVLHNIPWHRRIRINTLGHHTLHMEQRFLQSRVLMIFDVYWNTCLYYWRIWYEWRTWYERQNKVQL